MMIISVWQWLVGRLESVFLSNPFASCAIFATLDCSYLVSLAVQRGLPVGFGWRKPWTDPTLVVGARVIVPVEIRKEEQDFTPPHQIYFPPYDSNLLQPSAQPDGGLGRDTATTAM